MKNWCFWILVLENTLESPSDCKEIKPVNPKGNQPWIFTGKTDTETEAPILWPPDVKSHLTGKYPDDRKDWRQEKGMTEDETVGWHHWLNGHEFEHTQGDSEGQGSLACCSPWSNKELDTTEWLNNNNESVERDEGRERVIKIALTFYKNCRGSEEGYSSHGLWKCSE